MVNQDPLRTRWLVVEVVETGAIHSELSTILVGRFLTVHEDGAALPPDKRSSRGIHSFLAQLASGVYHIPSLEQMSLIGVDQ